MGWRNIAISHADDIVEAAVAFSAVVGDRLGPRVTPIEALEAARRLKAEVDQAVEFLEAEIE